MHERETSWAVDRGRAPLRVWLLGRFVVERRDGAVPRTAWKWRNAAALVKLLAVEPGHRLHRAQVLEALWPETLPAVAENRLRKAFHAARHALEPELSFRGQSAYLHLEADVLALDEQVWVDVDAFRQLAHQALQSGDVADVDRTLAAYGGELLPEDRYSDWAWRYQEELRDLRLRVLMHGATLLERLGAYGPAAVRLRALVQEDPACEEAHRRLMSIYARTGNRRAALQQYEECRSALHDQIAAEPEPATQTLYRDIVADSRATDLLDAADAAPLPLSVPVEEATSPRMVGREDVTAELVDAVTRASMGLGAVVLLSGEAGVGKTRVIVELARAAHRRGAMVLWGAGREHEGILPYGPFVEALDSYLPAQPPSALAALADAYPDLLPLLPSLRHAGPGRVPVAEQAETTVAYPGQLFAAVARFLGDLATARPLLLVLEDLHAADAGSLQLLHYLARTAARRRWLIVASYRSEEAGAFADFATTVRELAYSGRCRQIDLHRLTRADSDGVIAGLLADADADATMGAPRAGASPETGILDGPGVDPALRETMYTLSRGNPLFIVELVRTLRDRGRLVAVDGRWATANAADADIPERIRALVEARVDRMPVDVREALALAAVAGMECSFAIMSSASAALEPQLGAPRLEESLAQAVNARLLEERPGGVAGSAGHTYAFTHPLVRTALYERLSWFQSARLHRAMAMALEAERGNDVVSLAHHYGRSSDEEKAVYYLERAGDRALALHAQEVGRRYFGELVERLDGMGRGMAAAGARRKLARALMLMARYDEALAVLDCALAAYRTADDEENEGLTVAQIGEAHFLRRTTAAGLAAVEPLCQHLGMEPPSVARAALHGVMACLLWEDGRYGDQLAMAERCGAIARSIGDDRHVAMAKVWQGIALVALERIDEGVAALEAAIPLLEATGDLMNLTRALSTAAVAYEERGEFRRQEPYLDRALEVAERLGEPTRIAYQASRRGLYATQVGDWTAARAYIERAIETDRDAGISDRSPFIRYALGLRLFLEGDWQAAWQQLEETAAVARAVGDLRALWAAQDAVAHIDLGEGRPQAARERLEPLLGARHLDEGDTANLLATLAEAAIAMGEEERASHLAQEALSYAGIRPNMPARLNALRAVAIVATERGRWDEAQRALDGALAEPASLENPQARGQVLHLQGVLHARQGNVAAARRTLQDALAIFRHLGAAKDVERTEAELRAIE